MQIDRRLCDRCCIVRKGVLVLSFLSTERATPRDPGGLMGFDVPKNSISSPSWPVKQCCGISWIVSLSCPEPHDTLPLSSWATDAGVGVVNPR